MFRCRRDYACCLTLKQVIEMHIGVPRGYAIVPMTVTGPVFPNEENYTFCGTAEVCKHVHE